MGEKEVVVEDARINYKGQFHLKNLYKFIKEWLIENGFRDEYNDEKYIEKFYLEKRGLKGDEMWWWWRTRKKENSFFHYLINIDSLILGRKKGEAIYQGKKIEMDSAEIDIHIKGILLMDPEDKWKNHPIMKFFYKKFRFGMFRKEHDLHKDLLRDYVYRLHDAVKKYLELRTFYKEMKIFRPEKGRW